MKKKIVLMKNVKYNFEAIKEHDEDMSYYDGEYVITSEPVEVEFTEVGSKTLVESQVAIIDKQVTKVNADAQAALTALEGRKAELLAICHDKTD